jgi:putative ABC transport system ATP-binding protein
MNSITLDKVLPQYFIPKTVDNPNTIWNKKTVFEKGNCYLIIAPSGSGKSTLATSILGNHFQYEGAIYYDTTKVASLSIEQIVNYRKSNIQLLFQDVRLINDLTIRENILLRTFSKLNNQIEENINSYAEKLGITKLLDKKAKNCSYGERQRAAILRSLINPTDFLIYDECFSHLDQENKEIAFQLIQKVAQENKSALLFFELNDFAFEHELKILNL